MESEKRICLNKQFSTTKTLFCSKPLIQNQQNDQFKTIHFLPDNPERKGEGGLRRERYFKHSLPNQPLVTVITVVFNGEEHLEEAMRSVFHQNYDNIEYIVIDGGSTDKTISIINKYENMIDYWVSEKDNGIYDAMNKGIKLATGKLIGILNSDDLYYQDTILKVVELYKESDSPCVIYGDMIKFFNSKKENQSYHQGRMKDINFQNHKITINHPTCFISKQLYKYYGFFNISYLYAADRELMIRFYKEKVDFLYLPTPLAKFRLGGETSNASLSKLGKLIYDEYNILNLYNHKNIVNRAIFITFFSLRLVRKSILIKIMNKLLGNNITNHIRIIKLSVFRK